MLDSLFPFYILQLPLHVQPFFSNLQAKLQQINCSSCNVRQIVQVDIYSYSHGNVQ